MSENNTQGKSAEALTQEEKVEFLKAMFSTLEIDQKLIFTDWCKEECEAGGRALLGTKMQEVNDKMNNFIATAYDKVTKAGKAVYDKTNEAFEPRDEDVRENTDKGDKNSFFS
jgi:hypothetical protein